MSMTLPGYIREVQTLNGRIVALSQFISKSAIKSIPFFKILRRKGKFEWLEECQTAFEAIKIHLAELPLLTKPVARETPANKPVYFVSKVLQGPETRYTEIEKTTLAVMTTAKKLRPYILPHTCD